MNLPKSMATASLVVLLGATAACGGNSSSSSTAAPAAATKATFCSTFSTLSSKTTPKQASAKLKSVGVPSDIDAKSKQGFDVLVAKLATLPDNAQSKDFAAMQKALSSSEQAEVTAFGAYLQKECVPTGSTTSSPSASPSN